MKLVETIRSHLPYKMLCWFLMLLILPCLLFAAVFFGVNQAYFDQERANLESSALSRCRTGIEQDLESCVNVYRQIQQHSNFLRFLNGYYRSVTQQLEAYSLEFGSMFAYAESYSPYIECVQVYTLRENLLDMNDNVKKISELGDYSLDIPTARGFWRYDSERQRLIYRRTLLSLSGDFNLGILEIVCSPSLIARPVADFSDSIGREAYIFIDGACFQPDGASLVPASEQVRSNDSMCESLSGISMTIQAGSYITQGKTHSFNLLSFTAFTGLLMLTLASILLFVRVSRLSGRIVRFSRYISDSFTEVPGAYTDSGHDELSLVVQNFNQMLERNNDLINQIKLEQLRQNEMAYQVLQAQVDPHFLYNALESIRMMAEMKDEPEISDTIFSLSKLMHYSFSINTGLVTIETELDLVNQYLKIQKMRLGEQLRFQIQCPAELYTCRCPQFVIQPLTENAIKYGRDRQHTGLSVSVILGMEREFLVVTVENNGTTMEPERMARIAHLLAQGEDLSELSSGTGVGLDNINGRMRYLYPESFSMELSTPENGGLRVSMRWIPESKFGR